MGFLFQHFSPLYTELMTYNKDLAIIIHEPRKKTKDFMGTRIQPLRSMSPNAVYKVSGDLLIQNIILWPGHRGIQSF